MMNCGGVRQVIVARMCRKAHLGHGIRGHQTEDVCLDTLVQPDHCLKLCSVELVRLFEIDVALEVDAEGYADLWWDTIAG